MRPLVAIALLFASHLAAGPARALSEADLRNCDNPKAELSIPGCTAIIDEPRVPEKMKVPAFLKRGIAHFSMQKFDAALADFEAASRLDPKSDIAFNEIGLTLEAKGDLEKAVAAFDRGHELKPDNADIVYNRGVSHMMLKRYDKAIADFREAIKIGPPGVTGLISKQGEYERPELARVHANYYKGLAGAIALQGDLDKAIAVLDDAVAKFPKTGAAYLNRAEMLEAKGEKKLALADLDRAAAIDGDIVLLVGKRALLRFDVADFAGAAADFRKSWAMPQGATMPRPYLPLWVQLTLARVDARAGHQALLDMLPSIGIAKDAWPYPVARMLLGELSPDALRKAASKPDEACEAEFYIGQYHIQHGAKDLALAATKAAAASCPANFVEARAAKAELARVGGK